MGRKEVIDQYFKLFKLDNRASQTELEIAYDVLTKEANLSNEEFVGYRLAFEYLMCNYYGVLQTDEPNKKKSDEPIDLEKIKEEKVYSKVLNELPQNVINNIEEFENLTGEALSDKVKVLFSTQCVNLPAFFNSIQKNKIDICGKYIWFQHDMVQVLKETVFCNLVFNTIYCEIFEEPKYKNSLLQFVYALKNTFIANKELCKYFRVEETDCGAIISTVLEHSTACHLKQLIKMKGEAQHIRYIMSSDFD